MNVVQAKDKDVPGIMRLYRQFNEERINGGVGDSDYKYLDGEMPWSKTLYEDDCVTLILKERNFILGFITLRFSSFNPFKNVDKLGEVDLIVIDKKLRRKGLGTKLLQRALFYMKTCAVTHVMLNVAKNNIDAVNFWQKHRFRTLSQTSFERSDGMQEETVYMIRKV